MVVPYTLVRKPRSRSIRLVVSHTGDIRVSAPVRVSVKEIEAFVQSRHSWIINAKAKFAQKTALTAGDGMPGEYSRYKARATKFIRTRVRELATKHNFTYRRITVRHTTSQWGSCSSVGDLSFTYKLFFLPPDLSDYVIIHELAHTKHAHHGRRFWQEVSHALPTYKKAENALNAYLL